MHESMPFWCLHGVPDAGVPPCCGRWQSFMLLCGVCDTCMCRPAAAPATCRGRRSVRGGAAAMGNDASTFKTLSGDFKAVDKALAKNKDDVYVSCVSSCAGARACVHACVCACVCICTC